MERAMEHVRRIAREPLSKGVAARESRPGSMPTKSLIYFISSSIGCTKNMGGAYDGAFRIDDTQAKVMMDAWIWCCT